MGFETAIDRLVVQQIHLAEKGEAKAETVRQQILDLWRLSGPRPAGAFQMGYAKVLLGIECGVVVDGPLRRWSLFGNLRAHDRRGERSWIADLLQDPQSLVDLLAEPELAAQVLPLTVRTLFWCGDLKLAVRAIEYLAAEATAPELAIVVDAAVADLLSRLESRKDSEDEESTASVLTRVMRMPGFDRLPDDVRSRYHKALATRLLSASEWAAADQHAEVAAKLASESLRMQSSCRALQALAALRAHSLEQVEPRTERKERDAALSLLDEGNAEAQDIAPEAHFLRGLLAYEATDFDAASRSFEIATQGMRRQDGRDDALLDRARFFHAAALLAEGKPEESTRALRLMEKALDTAQPDLESFYFVHEALKKLDRKLALRFLDRIDVGRGTSPDQLLFVALEYVALGEAKPAMAAAERVLAVAVDLDQRLDAMRVMLTSHNMLGERDQSKDWYAQIRDLLLQRGAFAQLEKVLRDEAFVGLALDHVETKVELANLYDEMEGKEYERAQIQLAIARSLRARKEVESLQQALGLLQEVACRHPELAKEDLEAVERLLELQDESAVDTEAGARAAADLQKKLGHKVRVLVVGGNERQRRHHPKFVELGDRWGIEGEWLETNYTSPQKIVSQIGDRLRSGIDVLVLLHWNRHETTEPAHELARKANVPARTVHYAGFTSLQVALGDLLQKLAQQKPANAGKVAAKA